MDSKRDPQILGEHGHTIVMESEEKSRLDHPPRQPEHQRRQRKTASVRIILVSALVLGLVGLGVSIPKSTTLWWRMPCHGSVLPEQDPSTMEATSAEPLQDSFPGRLQHETVEVDSDLDGPVASTFRRLRRQDNSTTSSTPPPPPPPTSTSTTISSSSTTPPPPPPPTTSSTKSSTSSPPPPPPPSSSATPPPPPPPTTAAPPPPPTTSAPPPPPPPPPSSTPQLTTIPGTSAPVSNNRAPTSSTSVPLVSSGNGNAGGALPPAPTPTPAPSPTPAPKPPPVPTTIDGGTILTRLTTLDRTGGQTVMEVPVTVPAQTAQVVLATMTSTRPNGEVVVVTATSYVEADPAATGESLTANEPSLHNAAPGKGFGGVAMGVVVGVMIGAALV